MAHSPRNEILASGVSKYSRTAIYKKKGMFKRKKTSVAAKPVEKPTTKTVPVKGAKNGKERVISLAKGPRIYPADDVKTPKATRKSPKTAKLRASITPGTVLILLAGRFRGKRVVFLKQLKSGLLLVTGPYKINGVPLKRVNQAYVIATTTKVDVSALKVDDKLNDEFFKREEDAKKTKEFFAQDGAKKKEIAEAKKVAQKTVDTVILKSVASVPNLKSYLNSSFTLRKGDAPHLMKF